MSAKALLIGINYRGTDSELNGCINDANNLCSYLCRNGFKRNDITLLTDDTEIKPTRRNIIDNIIDLFQSGADKLWLCYSGHGCFVKDYSGDENDGNDEALAPLDYETNGIILDDHLRGLFSFLKNNSKLTVILDCCHSGTGMDLTYNFCKKTCIWKRNRQKWAMVKDINYPELRNQIIVISGCLDSQTSSDAKINKQYQGALTYALLDILNRFPNCNYEQLILLVRQKLKRQQFSQIVHLSSSKKLNLNDKISL